MGTADRGNWYDEADDLIYGAKLRYWVGLAVAMFAGLGAL